MDSTGSDGITHPAGLPHSEIRGSSLACSYPRRFAAYRVLHRPSAPRHPPCALCSFKQTLNPSRTSPEREETSVCTSLWHGPSHYQTFVNAETSQRQIQRTTN